MRFGPGVFVRAVPDVVGAAVPLPEGAPGDVAPTPLPLAATFALAAAVPEGATLAEEEGASVAVAAAVGAPPETPPEPGGASVPAEAPDAVPACGLGQSATVTRPAIASAQAITAHRRPLVVRLPADVHEACVVGDPSPEGTEGASLLPAPGDGPNVPAGVDADGP